MRGRYPLVAFAGGTSVVGKEPSLALTAVIIGATSEFDVPAGLCFARGDEAFDRLCATRSLAFAIAAFQARLLAALQFKVKVVGGVVAIVPTLASAHFETFSGRTVFAQLTFVVALADTRVGFRRRAEPIHAVQSVLTVVVVVTARTVNLLPFTLVAGVDTSTSMSANG
jgi:hypothetical protein